MTDFGLIQPRSKILFYQGFFAVKRVQWKNTGGTETKNIKNSLLAMPVLRTCR